MYIKKIQFGTDLNDLSLGVMYIPTPNHTKAEIQTRWNAIVSGSGLDGLLEFLQDMGLDESGFPVYDPGQYTASASIRDNENFNKYLQFSPYTSYRSGSFSTNQNYYYLDEDCYGFRVATNGYLHVIDAAGDTTGLGVTYAGYSFGVCGSVNRLSGNIMFITSDGFVGTCRLYLNKNNSGLVFQNATISNRINYIVDKMPDADIDSVDPYLPDGSTPAGAGGGTGTFSETGDTIGIPGLPTLSAVDTGFITLFNPSAAQVKALANYMWSASFDLATFKNIVANPIDCILGLSIVPVNPPNAGSKVVSVGNIPTDVTLPYLSSQYVEVDCGTLNVQEFWGSYLDYSPYTKMSLYLPYIGIVPLDIDDVMNATITVKYHVDVLSGACVAYVLCNGTQLYTYVGQCSSNVPITSNDFTNTVNGILGIAGSIGKLAADGGASAPTEAAGIAANAINALKPNIQKSGAMSGTGGLMGVQTPYLICQRPRQSVPASQNMYTGYPANITAKLSDLSGYTEVDNIHLDGLSATQEEQQEIMDLLTSGVII